MASALERDRSMMGRRYVSEDAGGGSGGREVKAGKRERWRKGQTGSCLAMNIPDKRKQVEVYASSQAEMDMARSQTSPEKIFESIEPDCNGTWERQ